MSAGNTITAFDLPELMNRCMDDASFAQEMLDLFAKQVPDLMSKLESAYAASNWADAAKAVHTLKGSSGNLAAKKMHKLSTTLEQSLKASEVATTEKLIAEFRVAVGECIAQVGAARNAVAG
jgi:HPt (histidine-containing phosphotransfer) domain-containing protein